ncbi:lactosylceramide 4-alpha-galactosyltransferase-like [Pyrus ussuriensis x Pyrus communis]|uniref:Lactosylceramide 4-alpha-galactosyltransferase-like n=1 Tax=Pyrus ussuriensis x Pyrus communis TaxID=2448454 RepID=A0A5N5H244_9ROSA|nr:lactosylceramide 4-alpha-galactosyltransferase-like [Pyrus ussuriensis x Pyrus communis]
MSQKVFDYRQLRRSAKSPIFSVVSFAVIFFIIYADNIVFNLPMHPVDLRIHELLDYHNTELPQEQIVKKVNEVAEEISDPLVPPDNVTKNERLMWFRRKLPELEILKSNNLTKQFHGRVLEFLNHGCSVQFYMIWFSPATSFGKREFLAVDSLFNSNPKACLMILSKSMDSGRGYRIMKPILDRGFKLDPGYIPLSQNLANLVRLAMLYKYGGIYLDTDLILLKDFSALRNAIGAQSLDSENKNANMLNNAVMAYDISHPVLLDFLDEFASTFNGNKWGRSAGSVDYNLTILPPKAFYPVHWNQIRVLFRKPRKGSELRWVESMDLAIEEGSVMARLVLDNCAVCPSISNP